MTLHRVLFYWRRKIQTVFDISQGVAQGCSLLPTLFSNQLLDEVEKAGIGISIKNDIKVGRLMFVDDFAGLTVLIQRTYKS